MFQSMPTIRQSCPLRFRLGRCRRHNVRPGAVLVEFILAFPVLLIALLAVIEFGLVQLNLQQVALASRVGAEEASQTATATLSGSGAVPANILAAIDQQRGRVTVVRIHIPRIQPEATFARLQDILGVVRGECRLEEPFPEYRIVFERRGKSLEKLQTQRRILRFH